MKDLAIVFAGGRGMRMNNYARKPKHLLKIAGKSIIEYIIEALQKSNNIAHIVIVVGYRKKFFDYLKEKYPSLSFVYNADYRNPYFPYISKKLKQFFRPNQNGLFLTGDMVLYENYFQDMIPANTMAGFLDDNSKKKSFLTYDLNKNGEIQKIKINNAQQIGTLGEFARIHGTVIAQIIKEKWEKRKMVNKKLGCEILIDGVQKCNQSLKVYPLKKRGPSDVDNVNDLKTVRKLFKKKNN